MSTNKNDKVKAVKKVERMPAKVERKKPENPEVLIQKAIEKGLPVETMERLLAMRKELKEEAAKEAFFNDLSRFQASIPEIPKNKKVYNKDGTLRYSYAPLDVIIKSLKKAISDHGFSYTITTQQTDSTITATCNLHHRDGHTERTSLTVPIDKDAYMTDTQKIASALTYAKRYAFCDALGIMTSDEDDDAQATARTQEKPEKEKKQKPAKAEGRQLNAVVQERIRTLESTILSEMEMAMLTDEEVKKTKEYIHAYKDKPGRVKALENLLVRIREKAEENQLKELEQAKKYENEFTL